MRILFIGDIVGKPGRDILLGSLPFLIQKLNTDMVIVNGENAAHGFGITPPIADEFLGAGVDVITGGNHSWDKPEILSYIDRKPQLLRPHNLGNNQPGKGHYLHETPKGHRILVINLMARLFMEMSNDPFHSAQELLPVGNPGDNGLDGVVVDFHGEATSEKYCMGHFCDGRASLVVGTHTHVPTADYQILEHGTGYQTDAGMCGDYDSSIGMDKAAALDRMLAKLPKPRLTPAEGKATLCGIIIETHPKSGLCKQISPVRVGGRLNPILPNWD